MLQVEITLNGIEGMKKSEVNAILKRVYFEVGNFWRKRYLPLHFGSRATQRYGYTPRRGAKTARNERLGGGKLNRSYSARKYRAVGHTRPLEYTGEGKRQALYHKNIHATSRGVRVRLPRKFNLRNPQSKVRMADEIRAVRPDELSTIRKFAADLARKLFREKSKRVTVRTSIIQD